MTDADDTDETGRDDGTEPGAGTGPEADTEAEEDTQTGDGTETDDETAPLADFADEIGIEATDDEEDSLDSLVDDTPLGGVDPDTTDITAGSDTPDDVDVSNPTDETDLEDAASNTETDDDTTAAPETETTSADSPTTIDVDAVGDDVDVTTTGDDVDAATAGENIGGTAGDGVDATAGSTPEDTPLSELAEEVAATEALDDSPFEPVETTDLDPADAWQRLEDDEQFDQPGSEIDAEPVEDPATAAPEHVVDKRQYCQQCPYLSAPPDVTCGREGTEIVEVTDADHFRVRACPMIGEDGPNFDAVDEE